MPLLPLLGLVALLLQPLSPDTLADSVAAPPPAAAPLTPAPPDASLFELLTRGGWAMLPIALLSMLALYAIVERLLALRRSGADHYDLMRTVRDHVQAGDLDGALRYCRAQDTPASRVVQAGLERVGRPLPEIRDAVQAAGRQEAFGLERRMDLLATAAALAPTIGFLGTITGLIRAFQAVDPGGVMDPRLLASGTWEALVAAAAGLAVGIPAMLAYNLLLHGIHARVNALERTATEFLDLLQSPVRQPQPARRPA